MKKTTLILFLVSFLFFGTISCYESGIYDSINNKIGATADVLDDQQSLDASNFTFYDGDTGAAVTDDFSLPVNGANGTTITWESDDSVVVITGNLAEVSRPASGAGDVAVNLTATISKSGFVETKLIPVTISQWAIGESKSFSAGAVPFEMKYVPAGTFPVDDIYNATSLDDGEATVAKHFLMGRGEVTYGEVAAVYQWAWDNGKMTEAVIDDPNGMLYYGDQKLILYGEYDVGTNLFRVVDFSSGTFTVEAGYENYPCNNISWFGAVLYTNWLTEMIFGSSDEVVYTWNDSWDGSGYTNYDGIADDGIWQEDETQADYSKLGFRLPSLEEWECASRYIGTIDPGYGIESPASSGIYWTPGDFASGASADTDNSAATMAVAWYVDNREIFPQCVIDSLGYGTHPVGTAGNADGEGTPFSGNANQLGIYDMCGNMKEMCFDEYPVGSHSRRYVMGGKYSAEYYDMKIGQLSFGYPANPESSIGFRVARGVR